VSDEHDPGRERKRGDGRERVDTSHLDGVADGCGCAEVWEHLSEGRGDDPESEGESEDGPGDGSADGVTATVTGASES
jgi:hypothetical protein